MDSVRQAALCEHSSQVVLSDSPDRRCLRQGVAGVKRQRDPLSDSEENVLCITEPCEGLKRQCLNLEGNENLNPLQLCLESPPRSGLRKVELEVKPDTPAITSVQSRLQQLIRNQGGDVEFRSRLERFELQKQANEEHPGPSTPRSYTLSSLARSMQERLHNAETPSMSRATRIRQEREEELRLVRLQPISDNPWLKRSLSDLSTPEVNPPLLPSTRVMRQSSKWQWPPPHPCDGKLILQVEDAEKSTSDGRLRPAGCDMVMEPALQLTVLESSEAPSSPSRAEELNSHGEMSTSKMIDELFEGVLNRTGEEIYEDNGNTDLVKGEPKGKRNTHLVEEGQKDDGGKHLQEEDAEEELLGKEIACHGEASENRVLENSVDELLDLAPNYILSPLSKSVEAAVTPLRLASAPLVDPQTLKPAFDGSSDPSATSVPLYSIDAYRTLQQNSQRPMQGATPAVRRLDPQSVLSEPLVSRKDRIKVLNEEAARLQAIITQTVQALNCCTDEGHGKGSLEEAEAEKLLLVSCEKRTALLTEVSRLRAQGTEATEVSDCPMQQPCRGTVCISNIQLPLKVEFVCMSRMQPGRVTCYFFILIRYGACNIMATHLATAADAHNGDTISFSTSIKLEDVPASFEIDVEVYSLSHTQGSNFTERLSTKSKVTPKKLLNTLTRSSQSVALATLPSAGAQRSSKFCLVGSHKVTLASLGQTKFLLDKMKFDGKIRRLLGDEFQEKVPFLSPLEGHIYLQLDCESHSTVQQKGFLTMFEDVFGFGAWQRRWFSLDRAVLSYWHYPNDECSKPPEGRIPLARSSSLCVRPVKRDSCVRPCTFELVSSKALQEEDDDSPRLNKCWFSADTVEEQARWTEKLNQALLDLCTWSPVDSDTQAWRPALGEHAMTS